MKPDEIEVDRTYRGGLHDDLRTVTGYGSSKEWLIWAPTHERLPLGGFVNTKCTSRSSFAKWATAAVPLPSAAGDEMTDMVDKEVAAAERALFDAIASLHNYGRPMDTGKLVDAMSALIDLKIAVAIELIADRVQDASGIRP